jgi:hypothetical protein
MSELILPTVPRKLNNHTGLMANLLFLAKESLRFDAATVINRKE